MMEKQNQKENQEENKKKIYEGKGPGGKLFKNRQLNRAKFAKNDEYYTLMKDVIQHVEVFKKEWYKDKIIYCPITSTENYNEKKEDTGLFTVYGWKRCALVECYNEEGKREFFRVLIYHE